MKKRAAARPSFIAARHFSVVLLPRVGVLVVFPVEPFLVIADCPELRLVLCSHAVDAKQIVVVRGRCALFAKIAWLFLALIALRARIALVRPIAILDRRVSEICCNRSLDRFLDRLILRNPIACSALLARLLSRAIVPWLAQSHARSLIDRSTDQALADSRLTLSIGPSLGRSLAGASG